MKNIILVAPPVAGKGTLSKILEEKQNYIVISIGDILRAKAKEDKEFATLMKSCKLIDDEIIFQVLEEKLKNLGDKKYILDGFPRTVEQAKMYNNLLKGLNKELGVVIYLDIEYEKLLQRVLARRICPNCKQVYSTREKSLMPKETNKCDKCNSILYQREDDTEEKFNIRYNEYINKTEPLINYYKNLNLLKVIKANDPYKTYEEVLNIIN